MPAPSLDDVPRVHPPDRAAWRAWLAAHHASEKGAWFVYFKKATGRPRVLYDEAVEEALCFGWVDSLPRKLDADRSMLLFTPRKARSPWSGPNKARVARLAAEGLMTPAGQAKVDTARADGSWDLLTDAEALAVPDDLAAALAADPPAAARFAAFSPSSRKGILGWVALARRPETRAARVARTAAMAALGLRANFDRFP